MTKKYHEQVLKDNKKPLLLSLSQFVIIIFAIVTLRPSTWYYLAGLITVLSGSISTLIKVWDKEKIYFKPLIKSLSKTFIIVSILYFVIKFLRGWGVIGFILIIIIIAGWRMWNQRDFLGESKAQIEIMMFGQPQTQKWRDKLGYEGTFKEYWRNKKNGNKKTN